MSDRGASGSRYIVCPYCGYKIDLAVRKPQTNWAGERFISCPNPELFSPYSNRKKSSCGQFIKLDAENNVVKV